MADLHAGMGTEPEKQTEGTATPPIVEQPRKRRGGFGMGMRNWGMGMNNQQQTQQPQPTQVNYKPASGMPWRPNGGGIPWRPNSSGISQPMQQQQYTPWMQNQYGGFNLNPMRPMWSPNTSANNPYNTPQTQAPTPPINPGTPAPTKRTIEGYTPYADDMKADAATAIAKLREEGNKRGKQITQDDLNELARRGYTGNQFTGKQFNEVMDIFFGKDVPSGMGA